MDPAKWIDDLLQGDADRRLDAARNLVEAGQQVAFSLACALERADRDRQRMAIESLAQMGIKATPLLIGVLGRYDDQMRKLVSEALVKIRPPATEALIACLENPEAVWCARQAAARILGELGDPAGIEALLRLLERRPHTENAGDVLRDRDDLACAAAIEVLVKLGNRQVLAYLPQLARDPSASILHAIASALENHGYTDTSSRSQLVDACISMLDAPIRYEVRSEGRYVISDINPVRLSAARTLIKLEAPKAIPALLRLLREDHVPRSEILNGLKNLQLDAKAIPALLQLLREDHMPRGEILDSLKNLQLDAGTVPFLLSATEGCHTLDYYNIYSVPRVVLEKLKQIGPTATDSLLGALVGPNSVTKLIAAMALASFKDVRAAGPLLEVVRDRHLHGDSAYIIAQALANIGVPALEFVLQRLDPADNEVDFTARRVLEELGTAAVPILIQVMKNKDVRGYVRYVCSRMITPICRDNIKRLENKWKACVCTEHLATFCEQHLPFLLNFYRIWELRNMDSYLRQSASYSLIKELQARGFCRSPLEEAIFEAKSALSARYYYACPICHQDKSYYFPVNQIVLFLDDNAAHSSPFVQDKVLYYPWSPLSTVFRFDRIEVHSIAYPYSTTIERFIHRLELERRTQQATGGIPPARIPCKVFDSCKLSAADRQRLQQYCELR